MSQQNGYIGRSPGDSAVIIASQTFEPTGIQTDFTFASGYTAGYLDVYFNGARLVYANDYTATDGSTVGLTTHANNGDVLELVAYKSFNVGSVEEAGGNFSVGNQLTVVGHTTATTAYYTGIVTATSFYDSSGVALASTANVSTSDLFVVGVSTLSGNVQLPDNTSLFLGGDDDLEILHTAGANSYIKNNTGQFEIRSNTSKIFNKNASQTIAGFTQGASVGITTVGILTAYDTTQSTSASTGAVVIHGGVGIAKSLTVGGNISVGGTLTYEDVTNVDSVGLITARSGIQFGVAGVGGTITAAGHAAFENGLNVSGIATASGLDAAISVWTLGASGTNHYTFTGPGVDGDSDPDLQLIRGQKYIFKNRSGGHPFRIQSTVNGSTGTAYNGGVTNNDAGNGTDLTFDVPYTAPSVLYYQCTAHANMGGVIYIGSSSGDDIKVGVGATIHASSGNAVFAGIVTATDLKVGTKSAATTGKAIAMAMVFGF